MRLQDYLDRENIGVVEFGQRIGRSAATVSRIARGLNRPDGGTLDAILRETGGEVTPNDFFDIPGEAHPAPGQAA